MTCHQNSGPGYEAFSRDVRLPINGLDPSCLDKGQLSHSICPYIISGPPNHIINSCAWLLFLNMDDMT